MQLWDLAAWRELHRVEGHANSIHRVLFSRDKKKLITAADERADALQEWDAATGKKRRTLWSRRLMGKYAFHLSPDHRVLTVAGTEEKSLLLCSRNTTTGEELRRVTLPFNTEFGYNPALIVLSPEGTILTNEAREGDFHKLLLLFRDATTKKEFGKLAGDFQQIHFSPDSVIVACVGRHHIELYNATKGRKVGTLPFFSDEYDAQCAAFSPDGRLLVAASSPGEESRPGRIDLWETITRKKRATLRTSVTPLLDLAFSPDGTLLVGGDSEGVLHLWSVANGKEIGQLSGHRGRVASLAFSHDGALLASGGWDTTALIWDMREAAKKVRPPRVEVPRERLERLWADLGGDDGVKVHRAVWKFVAAREIVPWLRDRLKPVPSVEARRISGLIADLDSDTFSVREKAARALETIGEAAEPALRKVLAGKPSLKLRRRLEAIVNKGENWPATSAALRDWRALEVLEHLGTLEARRLLEQLADGTEARLTREAKAALRRLKARGDTMP